MCFEWGALWFEDVVGEHVADGAGAFAFVGGEHVVELQGARK